MAEVRRVTASAGVLLAPNPSVMTLEGTNTWVLAGPGSRGCVVVDPGPADDDHVEAVLSLPVEAFLLTHHHLDHSGAADYVHRATGAPVRALDPSLCRGASPLHPGETMTLAGVTVRVLGTPGHTADSVCFQLPEDPAVLSGDTILGSGTTVVAHPDGRLADYLASLRLLARLDGHVVLPGHGPTLPDAAAAARAYLEHRQARLRQVSEAVAAGARDAMDVVRIVYADVDPALWPAAERSVQAQLAYLADRGGPP